MHKSCRCLKLGIEMLKTKFVFLFLLAILLGAGAVAALFVYDINSPISREGKKEVVVSPGASVAEIAGELESEGLIRSATTFSWYVRLKGLSSKLQAGRYEVPPNLSLIQIVELLGHGTFDVRLTFLEGWRKEQYLEYALEKLAVNDESFSAEFTSLAKDLEGYLFPDTYVVPVGISASELVEMLRSTFDSKYETEVLPSALDSDLTKDQIVIIASLLERETLGGEEEMKTIAGILIKRWKSGWRLDVDATVQYIVGRHWNAEEDQWEWWKDNLTSADLATDSPYNTYKNKGLPPGPISNPGLSTLLAAAKYKKNTLYWFYLHGTDGEVHYAETLAKHSANRAKYLLK